jgi:hypothetical protein
MSRTSIIPVVVATILLAAPAWAVTCVVNSEGTGDFPTI